MIGDVKTELARLLSDLCEKTGVEVRLAPTGGQETKFTVNFRGTDFSLYMSGAEKESKTRAALVRYLVDHAEAPLPEKDEYLKSILLAEGGKEYAYRFLTKYNITDGVCCALEILPGNRENEVFAHIENCLSDSGDLVVRMDSARLAVVRFADGIQSPVEFGQFLCQSLYEELGVKADFGIGCETKSFTDVAVSYSQAATAVRMSALFRSKGEVHTYREYLLVKMLEDIPETRLKEYAEQFGIENAEEVLSDSEMMETAEEFLENSLNISETSRNLFMHRNTLMYRLDKIERMTGLNIRSFPDAVTFRVITILYKLSQS